VPWIAALRTFSFQLGSLCSLLQINQINDRGIHEFAMVDPNPMLLPQTGLGPYRAQSNFDARAFDLKSIACTQLHLVAQSFREDHASDFVYGHFGIYNTIV
jgi:hypothetical protein